MKHGQGDGVGRFWQRTAVPGHSIRKTPTSGADTDSTSGLEIAIVAEEVAPKYNYIFVMLGHFFNP